MTPARRRGPDFADEAVLADFTRRLYAHDPTLWSEDPAHRAVAANRLGWVDLPLTMAVELPAIERFVEAVRADGLTHAVLLGMGGSSLAPEVLRDVFGVRPGYLALTVLDDTSPAAVRAVSAAHDPARTLFVVASKSGGTIEVTSFERHFMAWARAALGDAAGRHFVAITDPGTALERHAREHGYRDVFVNPPDVGGRWSALSLFGLVPAALIGVDVRTLLEGAAREHAHSGPDGPLEASGADLGGALGQFALDGRDKLTLLPDARLAPFGSWLEQLMAESTGKDGRGIVPVDLEPPGDPAAYGDDRLFVRLIDGPLPDALEPSMQALHDAGHPILVQSLEVLHGLGGAFLHWELATAAAAAALGVDPFDEPNVAEAKEATRLALEARPTPPPVAAASAEAPAAIVQALGAPPATDPGAWLRALPALVQPGDYVALLAFLHRTPALHERLQRLRAALRDATRAATTLGYGPRFLHSTGQLHKGGAATGVFVQLIADEGDDVPIPGMAWGFAALHRAQADGDYDVLVRHGRRVVRLHLGADPVAALDAALESLAPLDRTTT